MESIKKFNALNGKFVTRKELSDLKAAALKEGSNEVSKRVGRILDRYPDIDAFNVNIKNPIKPGSGLGAPRHKGLEKDALDECGRLKPGFRYLKGGKLKKIEKKEKPAVNKTAKKQQATKAKKQDPVKIPAKKETKARAKKTETQVFEKRSIAPEAWIKADSKKTTSLVKKYLKEKYGIIVSVRSEVYSGGSSFNISYNLGTDPNVIEAEMKRLQYGSFNGMEDIYEYSDESFKGIILDGYRLDSYKYVFVRRELPEAFRMKLAKIFSDKVKFGEIPEFDGTKESFHERFRDRFSSAWNWSDMVYQYLQKDLNFATQDENEIKNLELKGSLAEKLYFTYEHNGKEYDTRKPVIHPTKMVKEKCIIKNEIKLIDFGTNSIAVIGHTGEIEDSLEDLGGIKNNKIMFEGKIHKGYVFHKKQTGAVSDILIDYSGESRPGLNGSLQIKKRASGRKNKPGYGKGLGFVNVPVSEILEPVSRIIPAEIIQAVPEEYKPVIPEKIIPIKPAGIANEKAKSVPEASAFRTKNPLVKSMAERSGSGEFFEFTGSLGSFIGRLEKKPKESVVITLDAPQGAGKTRLFFQIMNLCASHGMKVLYLSFEEHPDSELFTSKRDQYIDPENHDRIDTIAELPNGYADFKSLVPEYDAIFTDSFGKKETKCGGKFDLDNDQRKAFDGKVFFDIYQRTQDNKMRGGSLAQFDADAVMKIEKDPTGNYENNIAYFDKHRYHTQPLNLLRYNIFSQEMEGGAAAGNAEITEII